MIMNNVNPVVKTYLKEVSDNLIFKRTTKRFILKQLESMAMEYISDNPECSINDLYSEFGSPHKISQDLESREDLKKIVKQARKRTLILIGTCIVLSVLVIFGVVFSILLIQTMGGEFNVSNIKQY